MCFRFFPFCSCSLLFVLFWAGCLLFAFAFLLFVIVLCFVLFLVGCLLFACAFFAFCYCSLLCSLLCFILGRFSFVLLFVLALCLCFGLVAVRFSPPLPRPPLFSPRPPSAFGRCEVTGCTTPQRGGKVYGINPIHVIVRRRYAAGLRVCNTGTW